MSSCSADSATLYSRIAGVVDCSFARMIVLARGSRLLFSNHRCSGACHTICLYGQSRLPFDGSYKTAFVKLFGTGTVKTSFFPVAG